MLEHGISVIEQGLPGLIAVLIAAACLFAANLRASLRTRAIVVAPGAILTVALLASAFGSHWTSFEAHKTPLLLFNGTIIVGALAIIPAARAHTASPWWLLLVAAYLLGGALIWFIGTMAIAHDWI